MKWRVTLFLTITLVVVFCEEIPSKESPPPDSEEEDFNTKFVPTAEWQKVKKGQPLPAGLHYRLNINTGETEAKLLEQSEVGKQDDRKTGLVALPPGESNDNSESSPYMSNEELKRVLADITADDTSQESDGSNIQENQVTEKFRSYENLKQEFGSLNLTVKTDMELLNELVIKAKEFLTSNDNDETVIILRDIEYLVHQIDNAREFIRLGGLSHVISPALNSTSSEVRAEALWLLGSAVQSNPKVQVAVLNAGIMPSLVKAAVLDSDVMVHARAVYALSCLTRQFPAAQSKLITEGGLTSLGSILDSKRSSDFKTKMRVVTLIYDLLLERTFVRKAVVENENLDFSKESETVQKIYQHKQGELKEKLKQYEATSLERRLVEDGWCQRLSEFLWTLHESGTNSGRTQRRDDLGSIVSKDVPYRPEHDVVEKVIETLHAMKDLCQKTFQHDHKLEEVLKTFLSWYKELSIREEVLQKQPSITLCSEDSKNCHNGDDSESQSGHSEMYYSTIADTLKQLLDFVQKPKSLDTNNYKEEL